MCGESFDRALLAEARWYPYWESEDGACPACVQENLLRILLAQGDEALHETIQTVWPLDAEAAFGVLPTRLRLHADPRFSGQGVTIALLDSGFYPHPDLIQPRNRIRVWVDATEDPVRALHFGPGETPEWPDWDQALDSQWHGTMTSTVAAGNGFLSHGLYSGLACSAELVLVQVRDARGHITNANIERGLTWLLKHSPEIGVKVVSLSVSGDPVSPLRGNGIDEAIARLVDAGISVVAAAGNDGYRQLLPPATAPLALTVGGLDDMNVFNHDELALWHSNYGNASNEAPKPEIVAPSIWVAAPILPMSAIAHEAQYLFSVGANRASHPNPQERQRIEELRLITPTYQHVEGTSFAAPLVAGTVACLLEADPTLTPLRVRHLLIETAHLLAGVDSERQGAGALSPGEAVARALAERDSGSVRPSQSPGLSPEGVTFSLHDHHASQVEVIGSWNDWRLPGISGITAEPGFWRTNPMLLAPGQYAYKFLLDGQFWLEDPVNPRRHHDGAVGFNSIFSIPG